jgi:hypothetical protein
VSREIDGYYDVYAETYPRAAKDHTCDACNETIPAGHHYARVSVVYEGTANTHKRCFRCQRLHVHLRGLEPGELWPDERLDCGEGYEEHWGGEPPAEIAALAFALPEELQ